MTTTIATLHAARATYHAALRAISATDCGSQEWTNARAIAAKLEREYRVALADVLAPAIGERPEGYFDALSPSERELLILGYYSTRAVILRGF